MQFTYAQVFLMVWIIAFWTYYFLTYGKVEEKHERSARKKFGINARWAAFFGLAFAGWTVVIFIFFFHYNFIEWVLKFHFIDMAWIKIFAMIIMCFAFLLNIFFTISVGKSIKAGLHSNETPKLVTSGIYGYIRHPGYLAFLAMSLGSFLIVPNLITVILLIYTWVVIYGHTLEEEQKLLKIYGEAYKNYQSQVGRYVPKFGRK